MASKGKAQDLFRSKAPWIMALLIRDFKIGLDDSAAILGNLGHESGGFASLQEAKPTVPSSRGGYGWAQWTGPRRRSFEAYSQRAGLPVASDQANYGFLFSELKGPYRAAIAKLQAARTLNAKVKAFELAYEQAGVKHYESRDQWAAVALDAWHQAGGSPALPDWAVRTAGKPASAQEPAPAAPQPAPAPQTPPSAPPVPETVVVQKPVVVDPGELHKPVTKTKTFWTWLLTILGAPLAAFGGLDFRVQLVIIGLIVAFGIYGIARRAQLAQAVRDLRTSIEG